MIWTKEVYFKLPIKAWKKLSDVVFEKTPIVALSSTEGAKEAT
jgi:hypothetical protein